MMLLYFIGTNRTFIRKSQRISFRQSTVCFKCNGCEIRKWVFFERIKYYHLVKQVFIDLQKIKCYSSWSKLPVKRSQLFAVNHDMQELSFVKLSQKGAFPERNLWYRFLIAHLAPLFDLLQQCTNAFENLLEYVDVLLNYYSKHFAFLIQLIIIIIIIAIIIMIKIIIMIIVIIIIIIALIILGLKTSSNLQQFKYKNDIK